MPILNRSGIERRSVKDRRRKINLTRLTYHGSERRDLKSRRSTEERRNGWVRISKWSSIHLTEYKIAKYLK